jgi:hypothetical protein
VMTVLVIFPSVSSLIIPVVFHFVILIWIPFFVGFCSLLVFLLCYFLALESSYMHFILVFTNVSGFVEALRLLTSYVIVFVVQSYRHNSDYSIYYHHHMEISHNLLQYLDNNFITSLLSYNRILAFTSSLPTILYSITSHLESLTCSRCDVPCS